MTKADLIAVLAPMPDSAEIWLSTQRGVYHTACILRVENTEIWLGDRSTLRDELTGSETMELSDDLLWHDPADLPSPTADLATTAINLYKTTLH
jgi:hypothetical protein